MAGDHGLLACGNDTNVDPAVRSVDAFVPPIICRVIDPHSQPLQPLANSLSYLCAMLADTAGKDEAFQALKHSRLFKGNPGKLQHKLTDIVMDYLYESPKSPQVKKK